MAAKYHVLHVIGGLARGGVETLVMNMMRELDREHFQFDFLVQEMERADYDDEVEALGGRIHRVTGYKNLLAYGRMVARIMSGYDIVHSHVYAYSGFHMLWAKRAAVKRRIAHGHTVRRADEHPRLMRRLYLTSAKKLIQRYSTDGLACTNEAGRSLFGKRWDNDSKCQVLPNAISLESFATDTQRVDYRKELGIPASAPVLGHVGRFVPEKNHLFMLEIFSTFAKKNPDVHLVLVGDGPGRKSIEQGFLLRGWQDQIHFLGIRSDVPALMRELFDIMLLPSKWEGVPLTIIESQAAGLPCLASSIIPDDAILIPELVKRLHLADDSLEVWSEAVEELLHMNSIRAEVAFSRVSESAYNAKVAVKTLEAIYSKTDHIQT